MSHKYRDVLGECWLMFASISLAVVVMGWPPLSRAVDQPGRRGICLACAKYVNMPMEVHLKPRQSCKQSSFVAILYQTNNRASWPFSIRVSVPTLRVKQTARGL